MKKIFQTLFGCMHRKYTFPLTLKNKETYVVCLNCGKEMPYDWKEMKVA